MKILVISQYYYPEQFQINEIAPSLVKLGHEVTVLCGLPNYPKGKLFEGYDNVEHLDEYVQGVHVIRCNQIMRGKTPITLALNYVSFARNSKKKVKSLPADFDVVIGYQLSPVTSMAAAMEYKRLYGAKVLFYTLDLWPVSLQSQIPHTQNPLYRWVAKLSKDLYCGADKILVTSRPFIDYLHATNGVPLAKMAYLPQHAGTEMLEADLAPEENGVADFMFAGNLGAGQRVDVIIKAAIALGSRSDYKIHIVGDGSKRTELEELVRENKLESNVIFYGNQQRSDMPKFYKMADALLITLRGNNEVGNTMPGKLQMYMTTGKPILGAINGAANEVINESRCGACVQAGDAQGLADLMKDYIEHPESYQNCGDNARNYFKANFTLGHFMEKLVSELFNL